MKPITAISVDDEKNNIKLLNHFLEKYCPMINVIGEAFTKDAAIKIINEKKPQLLFLDIELDVGSGFDVLKEIEHKDVKVIFVTAFDEYAIKSFKYNTIDYILKPIQIEELITATNRALNDVENDLYMNLDSINNLFESFNNINASQYESIPVRSSNKINLIKTYEISYLESNGSYTVIHLVNGQKITTSKNIGEHEKLLDKQIFFRIHHSYLINTKHVVSIQKNGGIFCEMPNNTTLPISKRKHREFLGFLNVR